MLILSWGSFFSNFKTIKHLGLQWNSVYFYNWMARRPLPKPVFFSTRQIIWANCVCFLISICLLSFYLCLLLYLLSLFQCPPVKTSEVLQGYFKTFETPEDNNNELKYKCSLSHKHICITYRSFTCIRLHVLLYYIDHLHICYRNAAHFTL